MNIKTLLTGLVFISLCVAQDINISGIVTDTNDMPVVGANVILESFGLNDTTGMDGKFLITDAVTGNQIKQSTHYTHAVKIFNGFLCVNAQKESLIEIVVYTLQGRVVSKIKKIVFAGMNSITLSHVGAGIYFYHIKIGNNKFVLKNNYISKMSASMTINTNNSIATTSRIPTGEVIKIVKDGYFDHQMTIASTDINDIKIKLIIRPNMAVDIDGNVYWTVKIGTQVWMIQNLRTTRYNDGSLIPIVTDSAVWPTLTTPGYCYYNNTTNTDSIKKYGVLYNWYAVDTKKLAPAGWRVPTRWDFDTLRSYLITNGFNWDGTTEGNKMAKSLAASTDWKEPDTGIGAVGMDLSKNNRSMFTGLPCGYRFYLIGKFCGMGSDGYWWSSTIVTDPGMSPAAWHGSIIFNGVSFFHGHSDKRCGQSVRLLRDAID